MRGRFGHAIGGSILLVVSVTLGLAAPTRSEPESIYEFDPRADSLLALFFPTTVETSDILNSLAWVADPRPVPSDLNEVLVANRDAGFPSAVAPTPVNVSQDHLESDWLSLRPGDPRADSLLSLEVAGEAARIAKALDGSVSKVESTTEKALFQRDLSQMVDILWRAIRTTKNVDAKDRGLAALQTIGSLWRQFWLTGEEFELLRSLLPTYPSGDFSPHLGYDRDQDYLPLRVSGEADGWYRISDGHDATRHFRVFNGRSFIHVFIRTPGWSEAEFLSFWARLYDQYSFNLTVTSSTHPLPAGTETLLVRTFGVVLADGSLIDSGFPEEVLIRVFKTESQQFDTTTTDLRGTLSYQYKMRRRSLMSAPGSLGLHRVEDDAPQFVGFFAEVPDPFNSNGRPLGTRKFNCIGCHSEILFGVSSVFSLGTEPPATRSEESRRSSLLTETAPGRFRIEKEEYKAVMELLHEPSRIEHVLRD